MYKFSTETNSDPNPNCPHCNHSIQWHTIVREMGMTVCRVSKCKCTLSCDYSKETLERYK